METASPSQRGTVLVVDDDRALGQTVCDFLAMEGVAALNIPDAESMLATATQVVPDAIVIDLMLAASSGVEIAAQLREGPFAGVPRIAISSSPFLLEIAEETDLFDHVLPKPLDLEQLLVIISETVARYGDRARGG